MMTDKQLAQIDNVFAYVKENFDTNGNNFGFNICELGTHVVLDTSDSGGWDVAFTKLLERINGKDKFKLMATLGYVFVIFEGSIPDNVLQLMKPCSQKGFYIEPIPTDFGKLLGFEEIEELK